MVEPTSARSTSIQRSDRLRLHPRIRGHNDSGRIRKGSRRGTRVIYGVPPVRRDLKLGRTPTSSRTQGVTGHSVFRSLKDLNRRSESWALRTAHHILADSAELAEDFVYQLAPFTKERPGDTSTSAKQGFNSPRVHSFDS